MTQLKQTVLNKYRKDRQLHARLSSDLNMHPATVQGWFKDNSKMLTLWDVLTIIADHSGIKIVNLLEDRT